MNPARRKLKIGDRVRVRGNVRGERGVRRIVSFYQSIPGGVRLDEPIADFVSWNVEELEKARRAS